LHRGWSGAGHIGCEKRSRLALHLLQHEPGVRLGLADFLNCGKQALGVRLDVTPRADHLAEHGAQLGVLRFEIGDAVGRISGEKVSCHGWPPFGGCAPQRLRSPPTVAPKTRRTPYSSPG